MSPAQREEILIGGGLVLSGGLLGLAAGHWVLGLFGGLLAYLAHQLLSLWTLAYALAHWRRLQPPFPRGLWREVYTTIARLQGRSRKRKRNLIRFYGRFRDAAAAVPDALILLDRERRITWCNPATRNLFGIGWPEADGRPISEIIPLDGLDAFLTKADYSRPLEFSPPHDRSRILALSAAPFGGKKHQRLVVAEDITEVARIQHARRDFVANVSHELRTPLTVISGFLETLGDAPDLPPRLAHPVELMAHQAQRMESIIADLLTLSRLELEMDPPGRERVDVPALITDLVAQARHLSKERHPIETHIEPGLWLQASETDLHSIFANLLNNAVRHTPPGTPIEVTWDETADGPRFCVRDAGPGIPEEHLPRLSERFYRVDKGRSRASGGTGLGLAIVKHMLQRHGGQLLIRSRVGEGSTFCCRFPPGSGVRRESARIAVKE